MRSFRKTFVHLGNDLNSMKKIVVAVVVELMINFAAAAADADEVVVYE